MEDGVKQACSQYEGNPFDFAFIINPSSDELNSEISDRVTSPSDNGMACDGHSYITHNGHSTISEEDNIMNQTGFDSSANGGGQFGQKSTTQKASHPGIYTHTRTTNISLEDRLVHIESNMLSIFAELKSLIPLSRSLNIKTAFPERGHSLSEPDLMMARRETSARERNREAGQHLPSSSCLADRHEEVLLSELPSPKFDTPAKQIPPSKNDLGQSCNLSNSTTKAFKTTKNIPDFPGTLDVNGVDNKSEETGVKEVASPGYTSTQTCSDESNPPHTSLHVNVGVTEIDDLRLQVEKLTKQVESLVTKIGDNSKELPASTEETNAKANAPQQSRNQYSGGGSQEDKNKIFEAVEKLEATMQQTIKTPIHSEFVKMESKVKNQLDDHLNVVDSKLEDLRSWHLFLKAEMIRLQSSIRHLEDLFPPSDVFDEKLSAVEEMLSNKIKSSHQEFVNRLTSFAEQMKNQTKASQTSIESNAHMQLQKIFEQFAESNRTTVDAARHSKRIIEQELGPVIQDSTAVVQSKLIKMHDDLKDHIYKTKLDIFTMSEKQMQLIRDVCPVTGQERENYVCDFYVEDFVDLFHGHKELHSFPWYISQMSSSVQGHVRFNKHEEMEVWILYARHPFEVGLLPQSMARIRYRAKVVDLTDSLPDITIGPKEGKALKWDETAIKTNSGWGFELGWIKAQRLEERGYHTKYANGAVLIRYEIEVLGCD